MRRPGWLRNYKYLLLPAVHASLVRIKRHVKASSQRRAIHDKTVLSVSRPLRRRVGGFPTTQDCRRQKISEVRTRSQQSSDSQRHATPDTTQTARSCRVWCRGDFSPVLTNPRRLHTHPHPSPHWFWSIRAHPAKSSIHPHKPPHIFVNQRR